MATVAHLLTVVVAKCPELIKPEMWDFITCSLVSWTGKCAPIFYEIVSSEFASGQTRRHCKYASSVIHRK